MNKKMDKNNLNSTVVKPSKTIIFGTTGFIGKYLYKYYKSKHLDTISFSRNNPDFYFDLEKQHFPSSSFLKKTKASYAIISAAVSKINVCEKDKETTYKINVDGTLKIIELLTKNKIIPIWFSSDYVFDGKTGNYDENSKTNPLTEYGKQKEIVEKEIPKITNGNHIIIRPGRVYSTNLEDITIFSEIMNVLKNKTNYKAAIDQIFSLTYIDDLIIGIDKLQQLNAKGLFHICSSQSINRYYMISLLAKTFSLDNSFVKKISLDELNESFLRPKNTSMKSTKFLSLTNINIRNLDSILNLVKNNVK